MMRNESDVGDDGLDNATNSNALSSAGVAGSQPFSSYLKGLDAS